MTIMMAAKITIPSDHSTTIDAAVAQPT